MTHLIKTLCVWLQETAACNFSNLSIYFFVIYESVWPLTPVWPSRSFLRHCDGIDILERVQVRLYLAGGIGESVFQGRGYLYRQSKSGSHWPNQGLQASGRAEGLTSSHTDQRSETLLVDSHDNLQLEIGTTKRNVCFLINASLSALN